MKMTRRELGKRASTVALPWLAPDSAKARENSIGRGEDAGKASAQRKTRESPASGDSFGMGMLEGDNPHRIFSTAQLAGRRVVIASGEAGKPSIVVIPNGEIVPSYIRATTSPTIHRGMNAWKSYARPMAAAPGQPRCGQRTRRTTIVKDTWCYCPMARFSWVTCG